MKYTKEEILFAGELGEVSMIDVRHVVSLLDEAREKLKRKELEQLRDYVKEQDLVIDSLTFVKMMSKSSIKKVLKFAKKYESKDKIHKQ